MGSTTLEKVLAISYKINMNLSYDLAIWLLGIYQKQMKHISTDINVQEYQYQI